MKNLILKKIKTVIFDMDGTLLNTIEDIGDSVNSVLEQLGYPTHNLDQYKKIVGAGARDHVKQSLPTAYQNDETQIDQAFNLYKQIYGQNWNKKTHRYKGIDSLLTALELHCIDLAVLSNKPDEFLQLVMKHYFSSWHFTAFSGAIDNFPKKPAPDLVNKMVAENNFIKENVLFVGDSAIDIETAKRSGLISCGCLWGFRDFEELKTAGADFIIAHPLELLNLLGID